MKSGSFGGWSDPGDHLEPLSDPAMQAFGDRYERIDLIGVGGMGRVFEVFDRKLERTVALKEVAPHLVHTGIAKRLATEALLTACLEHPGIVSVHDVGTTDDGRLYYTMRMVRGDSLADRLALVTEPAERVLLLRHVLDVCHAVGYAHSKGIVHRDLKPANIVVGEFGETQVVDWGLACRLDGSGLTGSSQGTEGYMSPEAATGDSADARSDVWSLGVTLREVAGEAAPPDLVAIVERALNPQPSERYSDAHELAFDLERFLGGHRVGAYDYSTVELLRRLINAWRAPIMVALVALIVLLGVGKSAWLSTTRARDRAVMAESETRGALELSDRHLASSLEGQSVVAVREGRLPEAQVLAAHALVVRESSLARGVILAAGSSSRPTSVQSDPLPDCESVWLGARDLLCRTNGEVQVWSDGDEPMWTLRDSVQDAVVVDHFVVVTKPYLKLQVHDRTTGELLASWEEAPGSVGIEVAPDGSAFGIANGLEALTVSLPGLQGVRSRLCSPSRGATAMAFGSNRAFVMCRGAELVTLDLKGGVTQLRESLPGDLEPRLLVYSDGLLLGASVQGVVVALDPETGELLDSRRIIEGVIDGLVPIRGPELVAISGGRAGVRLWDLTRWSELFSLPGPTRGLARVGQGTLRVAGDSLLTWELPERPRSRRHQASAGLAALAVSPDGRSIAAARGDGYLTVWSTETGDLLLEESWQQRVVKSVSFSPDGHLLVAVGLGDNSVRSWNTADWSQGTTWTSGIYRRVGVLQDGEIWAFGYGVNLTRDVRVAGSGLFTSDVPFFDGVSSLDGSWAAIADERGRVWRTPAGGGEVSMIAQRPGVRGVAMDAEGRLALAFEDRIELLKTSGELLLSVNVQSRGVVDVALSPDGRLLAAGLIDGRVVLHSARTGAELAVLVGHAGRVGTLQFTGDSGSLYTGDWEGIVLRWDLSSVERSAPELVEMAEATWQLDLESALSTGL